MRVKKKPTLLKGVEYITVDPGLNGTGIAVWSSGNKLMSFSNFYSSNHRELVPKATNLCFKIIQYLKSHPARDAYVEYPSFFQSMKGATTASSGTLVKLCWFVGFLESALQFSGYKIHNILVAEWKGQLSKDIVIKRVKRSLKNAYLPKKITSHCWDAIGIGLSLQGKL